MTIKRMQGTLANDVFVCDTLRRNAADRSYMDSEAYRAELNRNYRQCTKERQLSCCALPEGFLQLIPKTGPLA